MDNDTATMTWEEMTFDDRVNAVLDSMKARCAATPGVFYDRAMTVTLIDEAVSELCPDQFGDVDVAEAAWAFLQDDV